MGGDGARGDCSLVSCWTLASLATLSAGGGHGRGQGLPPLTHVWRCGPGWISRVCLAVDLLVPAARGQQQSYWCLVGPQRGPERCRLV